MGNMFRLLRRLVPGRRDAARSTVDVEADARARAEAFWRRWEELLPQISAALGDGVPNRVDHQIAEAVALVHPDLTFSIERGQQGIYALVVTARADPALRVYTDAWMAAAPEADSLWEYHDAVPPVPDPTQVTVNLHGQQYPLEQVRLAARVDEDEGLVDVAVHHPGFAGLEEAERRALTFLPLDAALGERLAADRVGRVEIAEHEPAAAVGLLEFRDMVRRFDAGELASGGGSGGGDVSGGRSDGGGSGRGTGPDVAGSDE